MKNEKLIYRLAFALILAGPCALLAALCPFRPLAIGFDAAAAWLLFSNIFLPTLTAPLRIYLAAALDPAARACIDYALIVVYALLIVPAGILRIVLGRRQLTRNRKVPTYWLGNR